MSLNNHGIIDPLSLSIAIIFAITSFGLWKDKTEIEKKYKELEIDNDSCYGLLSDEQMKNLNLMIKDIDCSTKAEAYEIMKIKCNEGNIKK